MTSLRSFISSAAPTGWRSVPIWALFRRVKRTGCPDEELLSVYRDHGVILKASRDDNFNKASEDLSLYQLVNEGDLVTNKMKAWQGSIAISRHRGIVSPAYYVYRPLGNECDQFIHYILRSERYTALYQRISKGIRVNQWDLEHDALRNVPVLLPDLATQKAIAAFLDAETARIDALIEKKERFRSSLAAKRLQAVPAMFKRHSCPDTALDPHARRAFATGDGWSLQRVKHLVSFMTSGSRGWSDLIADEGELFLQSGNIGRRMEVDLDGAQRIVPQTGAEARRTLVKAGDVLVCITGGRTGAVGYVPTIMEAAYVNQHVCLLRPRRQVIEPELLAHLLFSDLGQRQFDLLQYGLKQGLGFAQVGEVRLPIPPRHAQRAILDSIHGLLSCNDRVEVLLDASIDRLREFRAALITAAVTGQIDPTDWRRRGEGDRTLDRIEAEMAS